MARNDDVRLEGRDPLELVLAAINTSQAELRELREEVRGAQEDTAAKLAALKTKRPYSFRKKGHEEQYVFNSVVNSKIAEAGLQLARVERGVADGAAKVALDAVKEALTKAHARPNQQSARGNAGPLSVLENATGKQRLVLNLRHVNQFVWKQKFKYEDLRIAMMLFRPAPYVFSKLMRVLVRRWRSKGLKAIMYLDDGICAVKGKAEAERASAWVRDTLDCAGLVVHGGKSVWLPALSATWLGFDVDLERGCVSVPEAKLATLRAMLQTRVLDTHLPARFIASLVGKIISMGLALGPMSRLMTRSLYALLASRQAWCESLEINQGVQRELMFWRSSSCAAQYNAQPIWLSPSAVRIVYSDASDTGYGGYTVEHGLHVAQGSWLPDEAAQSSTWRELVAVLRVLDSIAHKLRNMRVRWFSDNQNVVRILEVSSRQPHLQTELLRVVELCMRHNIRMEPGWIPREENQLADYFSRIVDLDDWQLDVGAFRFLNALWGPHTIDRFADHYNAQLVRFNSRFACPGAEAVDAFTIHWASVYELPLSQRLFQCGRPGGVLFGRARPGEGLSPMAAGVWPVLRNLEDPELQRLAEALPTTVLSSTADSTTKKYLGAFKRWKLWAEARQGVPVFPVQDIHLALYLQHLGESVESRAAAEEAVHALAWLHQVAGLPSVGDSPLVRVTLAGLGRRLARPKVRKEPVTADMLRAMVDSVGQEPSLSDVRLLAVCLVAFAGFMRCDELLKLHCSDVAFGTESMTITIVSSKTDQYREGSSLVIARTGTLTCPVAMMEKYFFMGGLCTHDQGKVFRALDSTKHGQRLRTSGGISYTRLRELLLEKIEQLGMDPKAFGMHSLRAGGATAAARAGVADRLFKCHGRWRSESAKDGYVKDALETRLSVTKQLGI
eukprot:Em0026g10a